MRVSGPLPSFSVMEHYYFFFLAVKDHLPQPCNTPPSVCKESALHRTWSVVIALMSSRGITATRHGETLSTCSTDQRRMG